MSVACMHGAIETDGETFQCLTCPAAGFIVAGNRLAATGKHANGTGILQSEKVAGKVSS